jgi:hypothetical protein
VDILHIDTGAEMRGGQYQVFLLLCALREAGHHATLLARKDSRLYVRAREARLCCYAASLVSVFEYSPAADIAHAHDARAHLLASVAARCPFVVSRRVAFPVKNSFVSRWKYSRAARYLSVSEYVAGELRKAGIDPRKIDIVYDAVDEGKRGIYDPAAPAVALGSSDPQKGRDLVAAAAGLSGIPVTFSENLALDLQRASMLVYITRSEGLGSGALLAMSMGIPVIASRVGGLTEVFEDGISGLHTANEPEQISTAMRCLVQSPSLAEKLIVNARRRAQERFSLESMLRATLASYKKTLDV